MPRLRSVMHTSEHSVNEHRVREVFFPTTAKVNPLGLQSQLHDGLWDEEGMLDAARRTLKHAVLQASTTDPSTMSSIVATDDNGGCSRGSGAGPSTNGSVVQPPRSLMIIWAIALCPRAVGW